MVMKKNFKPMKKENLELFEKQMEDAKKKSSADWDFYDAALLAKKFAKEDDLLPYHDEFEEQHYTVRQGLKAACYAREDVTAILLIQKSILVRLDKIKTFLWVCIVLLSYIAIRLT
jgi:hypothetical protein